ncbi:MAG TPA: HIT domain-containing protein [Rhodothermales bacterium]|nr:HIT domain-containing protein [Rhodothermales bacterium]
MNRIWSPWRSELLDNHVEASEEKADVSVFVRLEREHRDEENLILWRGQCVFVIMNRFPYNNGHLLIVPYRQVEDYEDLTEAEQIEIARVTGHCIRWLRTALCPEGFNLGMNLGKAGGAGIPNHLHMHVVPRWSGDTNFMPTVGDVKVVPEAMHETYRKLKQAIRQDHAQSS